MQNEIVQKIREFNRFYTKVIGVTNNHILESNYSLTEVRVMFEIYHHPGITAREIKNIIEVDEGYLSRLINKLVRKNIIKREKAKTDSRISILKLSKNGETVFLKLNQNSSNSVEELIGHLSSREKEELVKYFQKVTELLSKKS